MRLLIVTARAGRHAAHQPLICSTVDKVAGRYFRWMIVSASDTRYYGARQEGRFFVRLGLDALRPAKKPMLRV